MGWDFTYGQTRAGLVRELTTSTERRKCIAHSLTAHGSQLWSVWDYTQPDGTSERFIALDLIKVERDAVGYKGMCESMGPYYYACPLKYLAMAPVTCETWRAGVRAHWDRVNARRRQIREWRARQ